VPLSRNLGTLASWNPLGLSRPETGLLYLYIEAKQAGAYHLSADLAQVRVTIIFIISQNAAVCPKTFNSHVDSHY